MNLVRLTTLANNENIILSEEILLSDIDKYEIYFGDSLDDINDVYPSTECCRKFKYFRNM